MLRKQWELSSYILNKLPRGSYSISVEGGYFFHKAGTNRKTRTNAAWLNYIEVSKNEGLWEMP